jgi:hypothetical protein
MYSQVATKDPTAVEVHVQQAYLSMFRDGDPLFVPRVFGWTIECFTGNYHDYQPVDAHYHDLEHTLQGTLCMTRILLGRHGAGAEPVISRRCFELAVIAILLHDSGYLKKRDDVMGTGAKYTVIHVDRSADFAAELLSEKGYRPADISAVQHMIKCTGINAHLEAIPFQTEEERIAGYALATGDLLGQMAAEDYVDKLPVLYSEFAEAAQFTKDRHQFVASFSSADDLIDRTPRFWENFVLAKLKTDFLGLYRYLNKPYPDGPNWYINKIEANMDRLRKGPQN